MQHTARGAATQTPRRILDAAIWPFWVSAPLTAEQIGAERFVHQLEVEITRPSWQRALASALVGLGGVDQ